LQNQNITEGDGSASYSFTVSQTPIQRGHLDILGNLSPGVYITASDASNSRLVVTDSGLFPGDQNEGTLIGDGSGTVNYIDGTFSVTFNTNIPSGNAIQVQYFPYTSGRPRLIEFYNNVITLRPVPDKSYQIQFDAYLTPAAFLTTSQAVPFGYISEYIARGAARKILADTGDIEQFQFYEPLFREQEILVWKRSQRQFTATRTGTIFSDLQGQSNYNNIGQGST